jgi:hypothetical protein
MADTHDEVRVNGGDLLSLEPAAGASQQATRIHNQNVGIRSCDHADGSTDEILPKPCTGSMAPTNAGRFGARQRQGPASRRPLCRSW